MRSKKEINLSLPLEVSHPDEFGELDNDQKELILQYEALDLVLIENASELFRVSLQKEEVFENILKSIVDAQKKKNIKYLESETFPFYVSDKMKNLYKKEKEASSSEKMRKKYLSLVNKYKKKINRKQEYVSIIAVDLGSSGGHYAAFYYSNDKVTLFDSMQTSVSENLRNLYSQSVKSASQYTHYFFQLASDIFPEAQIEIPDCIKKEVSLQYTGGFLEDLPYFLENSDIDESTKRRLILQTTESQNHFCYLWSIWWIHMQVLGIDFSDVLKLFETTDPLIVIKKYGWCVVHILNIHIDYEKFFNKHFLSIWSNGNDKMSIEFNKYTIPKPLKCKDDINYAFDQSIQNIIPTKVSNTIIPTKLKHILHVSKPRG